MSMQPPTDAEIEQHLRERYRAHYGDPPAPSATWAQVAARLNNSAPRAQITADRVRSVLQEQIRAITRRIRASARGAPASSQVGLTGRPRTVNRIVAVLAPAASLLVIIALAAALFLPRLARPAFPMPPGWHDVTPPTTESVTSYVVSPDVAGLILACIGDRAGTLSASPMGPAHVWRTHDGGATWAQLPQPSVTAGCLLSSIRGERGGFVLSDAFATTPALWVTHDAGSSWSQIQVEGQTAGNLPANIGPQIAYQYLTQGIYRDGKVYTPGMPASTPPIQSSQVFAVTADDGRTWTALEASGPNAAGGTLRSIAADYRSSGAWLGLWASDFGPQASAGTTKTPAEALIARSSDDGRTWTVAGRIPTPGAVPQSILSMLATTPGQPSRVCAALWVVTSSSQTANMLSAGHLSRVGMAVGPPPPLPAQIGLYGSDDGGRTWDGGIVTQYQREYGGLVLPGLQIDPKGNCYLATTRVTFTPTDTTTIWRLPAGAGSSPQALEQLHGILLSTFALGSDPGGAGERLFAVAAPAGPLVVTHCYDLAPCVEPKAAPPHLIWSAVP